jgi:hypothetical protein
MNTVIESDRHGATRGVGAKVFGGNGGGYMDDVLKRLGAVEISLSDVREKVSAILAVIPHLATKADINDVRTAIEGTKSGIADTRTEIQGVRVETQGVRAEIQSVRVETEGVRTEVQGVRAETLGKIESVRTDMNAMEARIIRWMIGTAIASVTVASAVASVIAHFVH